MLTLPVVKPYPKIALSVPVEANDCTELPYQLTPSDINENMSNAPEPTVTGIGSEYRHLTLVKVAEPKVVALGCRNNMVNDLPAIAGGIVNVVAMPEVSVANRNVPALKLMVTAAPTTPRFTLASV